MKPCCNHPATVRNQSAATTDTGAYIEAPVRLRPFDGFGIFEFWRAANDRENGRRPGRGVRLSDRPAAVAGAARLARSGADEGARSCEGRGSRTEKKRRR